MPSVSRVGMGWEDCLLTLAWFKLDKWAPKKNLGPSSARPPRESNRALPVPNPSIWV